ncbi:hypothetical protein [Deinococcus pimensis]|uniref:hypothetical protein n=1 Tax=Deinococcus pimensis TaxID=309888 RepID=UPI0004843CD3|nr:hypothetical protein [Deinococcus pimensis]
MNVSRLGWVTVVTSVGLLVSVLRENQIGEELARSDVVAALSSSVFAVGWWCALLGLVQLRAAGSTRAGRGVLNVGLVLVGVAALQGVFDVLRLHTLPVYFITDVAWPLSMLWMLVIGVTVARTWSLPVPMKFVPLLCGTAFPLWVIVGAILGRNTPILSTAYVTAAWMVLGVVLIVARRAGSVSVTARAEA